jgi:hypothetical protein
MRTKEELENVLKVLNYSKIKYKEPYIDREIACVTYIITYGFLPNLLTEDKENEDVMDCYNWLDGKDTNDYNDYNYYDVCMESLGEFDKCSNPTEPTEEMML